VQDDRARTVATSVERAKDIFEILETDRFGHMRINKVENRRPDLCLVIRIVLSF